MSDWSPIALLPNVLLNNAIEGEYLALGHFRDARLPDIYKEVPLFRDFASRFKDAFGRTIPPSILIGRKDRIAELGNTAGEAIIAFRDAIAMSVIPYGRSLNTVYATTGRISYSDTFYIYLWTLSLDNLHLVARTPAYAALHEVKAFHGQTSPDLPHMELRDFDQPSFEALIDRWKRHYFGKRARWRDRALFRSLNMAFNAALIPAAVATSIFDIGRSISLWVSAFEILSHPRLKNAGLDTVYPLFENITYCDRTVGAKRYVAYNPKQSPKSRIRSPLPCWIYGVLYQARNDFLDGNAVSIGAIDPNGTGKGLFWLAPSLYRLALASALNIKVEKNAYARLADPHLNRKWQAVRDVQENASALCCGF